MKRISYLLLLFNILTLNLFGQADYLVKDTSMVVGVKLVDGNQKANAKFCQLKKGYSIIKYTPSEVKEYGFKDGRVYLSKEIQISGSTQRVFLERLVDGNTTLYFYRGKGIKTYFIEKDSSLLVELAKGNGRRDSLNFRNRLTNLTIDCPELGNSIKLVRYKKGLLTELISRYNNCEIKPFPYFKYGLLFGYESTKPYILAFQKVEYLDELNFVFEEGITYGLFVDIPIKAGNFSSHMELSYSRLGFSSSKRIGDKGIDFAANLSSLKLPVLVRYTIPLSTIRPFLNVGPLMAYNQNKGDELYSTNIGENTIEIFNIQGASFISTYQLGHSIGIGVEYIRSVGHSIFFEARYNSLYGFSETLSSRQFQFLIGINF